MMAPGLPRAAVDLGWRAGRVMNYGDGIYGGMFVSCMYAAAFFDSDPRRIVEAGLACLPARSPYAQVVADLLTWSKAEPEDWIGVWNRLEQKWNRREPCPEGATHPFNIDAKLNGAYVAMGVLYGKGDIGATMRIATRCGQDSDCNPSSAAGIVGVAMGYKRIPEVWKSGIPAIAREKFRYTDYSFETIVESTMKRTVALAVKNGGRVEGERLHVKAQTPQAARFEIWDDYGAPVERVAVEDPRWTWTGAWTQRDADRRGRTARTAGAKGAEVSIAFEGTGAILSGPYLPAGGKADVYLDGKLDRTVDVYPDEDSTKGGEAVWHAFGLNPGRHTVRLVVRGEPYPGSKGGQITLGSLIIFR